MKKFLIVLICIVLVNMAKAQIVQPVKWSFTATKLEGNSYEVHLTANLDRGWHIYSQSTPDGGPVATKVEFVKNPLVEISGAVKEIGKLEQKHEDIFGVDVKQFSNKIDFVQVVKLKVKAKTTITGSVKFMSCNDHECLPPKTNKFSIALN